MTYAFLLCSEQKQKEEINGIDVENLVVLERLKQNQWDEYLKVIISVLDSSVWRVLGGKTKFEHSTQQ